MASEYKVLILTGLNANLGSLTLQKGEMALTTDKGKLYVGDGSTKVLINPDLGTAAFLNVGTDAGEIVVLDAQGKLPSSVVPALAITDTHKVASKAAMGALNAQVGDVAIVNNAVTPEENGSYILAQEPASAIENWELLVPPTGGVSSVNGKTGTVVLTPADIGAEPAIATKNSAFNVHFEDNAANIKMDGAASAGSSNTAARGDHTHPTDTSRAPLVSPALSGTPTAPTAAAGTNTDQIATTKYVKQELVDNLGTAAPQMDGTATVGTSGKAAHEDHIHPSDTSKAPIVSPAFTGNPTAPTVAATDDSTNIATTAFVNDFADSKGFLKSGDIIDCGTF